MISNKPLSLPGDKSISHRVLILGAISNKTILIEGLLEADDVFATMQALQAMGVSIKKNENNQYEVKGVGRYGLKNPNKILNLKNTATGFRLLAGVLVAQTFDSKLTGDASLQKRPMGRIIEPLRQMGAMITMDNGVMSIEGKQTLRAIRYKLPVASAQVKSCLLLASLYAEGNMTILEPIKTRDHTERLMRTLGLTQNESLAKNWETSPKNLLKIPADISSVAFLILAITLTPDKDITLNNVGVNPTRRGVIDVLNKMGARIVLLNQRYLGEEPVADIRVRSATLKGIDICAEQIPSLIDECPILCIAAACASGITTIDGVQELRVKESDRIHAMADGLLKMGIRVSTRDDCMLIEGGVLSGGEISSFSDHRIAMAFQVASLVAKSPIIIDDSACISISFPNFNECLENIGNL